MKYSIGSRIVSARELRNMSAKTLAGRLGIAPSRLSNWETGVSSVSAEFIYKISTILNVTSDYLIGLSDTPDSIYESEVDGETRSRLVLSYAQLNHKGKDLVAGYASDLKDSGRYVPDQEISVISESRQFRHAAHGADLDSLATEAHEGIDQRINNRREQLKEKD